MSTLLQRFRQEKREAWISAVVRKRPDGKCRDWPWLVNNKGYATITWEGRQAKVGHLVLELSGRPRPEGAMQLHSCDNPRCVAPWHLRWGTAQENVADAIARGRARWSRGEGHGNAKLTDEAVREIRASSEPYRVLAARCGVHIKTIARVRSRKIWAHVEDAA